MVVGRWNPGRVPQVSHTDTPAETVRPRCKPDFVVWQGPAVLGLRACHPASDKY